MCATRMEESMSEQETMNAIIFARYGGPEVLELGQLPMPKCRDGEVLIRVRACGVNPADARIRSGQFRWFTGSKFPRSLGADIAGEVIVGAGPFAAGDRVFGMLDMLRGQGYADYAVARVEELAHLPSEVTWAQGAAVPLAALTAWQAFTKHTPSLEKKGCRVLIRGASGGVGSCAVQIAKSLGAHVTGLSSAQNLPWLDELGADRALDYRATDLTALDPFDLIFDVHGELPWSTARTILSRRGVYLTLTPSFRGAVAGPLTRMLGGRVRTQMLVSPSAEDMHALATMLAEGSLVSPLRECLPLEHASSAHTRIEGGHTVGKIVLEPSSL